MGCFPRSACLGSLSLTQSLNSLVLGEGLEIWDNHLWEQLGDSEWSRPTGLKLARKTLQSRVKKEDSITNVENAVFDFRVMESLRFLFIDQKVPIGLIKNFIQFIELNFTMITRSLKTVSDTVLKHDLRELVITEVRTTITNDGTRSSKPSKKIFKEFANNSGVVSGSTFTSTYFDKHFISLRNLSLTLTWVTRFDQVMGITIDCGPIKFEVKHLFGDVVQDMMSPGGSIVASLENVNGFMAVNTPPDDLIRIDFEQEGVVPKVMLLIFKEFVLCWEDIPLTMKGESTRAVLPWNLFNKGIFEARVIRIHNAFVHDEDHTYGKVTCIAHKLKGQVSRGQSRLELHSIFLKCLKGFNTLFGEEKWGMFLKKTCHRPGYLQKVLYESSIEAGITKKATNTLDSSGMRQLSNYIDFYLIYLNPILGDLMAEDDSLFDHEMTFLLI
nr:hypothetical protein [Tanacetum cinerariifolium]